MAQFDVHRNKGGQRGTIPYFVVVQSRRFDAYGRRTVIPLVFRTANPTIEPTLNPIFTIEERPVVLHTLQIASVPVATLGEFVASLEREGDRIVAAIDQLITRAWG